MIRFVALSVGLAALLAAAPDARACGGTMCSNGGGPLGPPPILQAGEHILFAFDKGEVTAHVQIQYAGDPRAFAWVVPVPSEPKLSVGSDQVFLALQSVATPQFSMIFGKQCPRPFSLGCGAVATKGDAPAPQLAPDGGGVNVVSAANIGPFETVVLSATDPEAVKKWLKDHGFDLPPESEKLVNVYVEKKDFFVALKLQASKGVGDLQPLVMKYRAPEGPCIPIRLTAVAATRDMPIVVYLLGEARAVPLNYAHLIVNPARIAWSQGGSNYPALVTEAANEAGGQGFATDFSGPSSVGDAPLQQLLGNYQPSAVQSTDALKFLLGVESTFPLSRAANTQALLARCVPLDPQIAAQAYVNPNAFQRQLAAVKVEQPRCGDEFDQLIVAPLRDVRTLLQQRPVLTRLSTTLSPEEMTLDPIFTFNKDLPPVPTLRTVTADQVCDDTRVLGSELTFPELGGAPFFFEGGREDALKQAGPALLRAEKTSAEGAPSVLIDNKLAAQQALAQVTRTCGCSTVPDLSLLALGAVLLSMKLRRFSSSASRS